MPAIGVTGFTYPWHVPLKNSQFNVSQWNRNQGACAILAISATHCSCYVQSLVWEWVIILRFPPVMYLSTNCGERLHYSRGWCNSDWWNQLLWMWPVRATGTQRNNQWLVRMSDNGKLINMFTVFVYRKASCSERLSVVSPTQSVTHRSTMSKKKLSRVS